jgi:hypothetical protein
MIEILYRPINGHLFKDIDVRGVIAQLQMAYDYVLGSDWIDDPRIVHIRFKDLLRDPTETIRAAYAARGIPFMPTFEAAIQRWVQDPAHRSDRYGKFDYSLEQFGLSAPEIRAAFAGYCDRFGL